jgi:transposase
VGERKLEPAAQTPNRRANGNEGISRIVGRHGTCRPGTTGSAAPGKMGGHRPRILTGECRTWLLQRIASGSDMTLRGLVAELAERGVKVSYRTVWNFVHREKVSYKKERISGRAKSPRRSPPSRAIIDRTILTAAIGMIDQPLARTPHRESLTQGGESQIAVGWHLLIVVRNDPRQVGTSRRAAQRSSGGRAHERAHKSTARLAGHD